MDLPMGSSKKELKEAYKKLALLYHPDKTSQSQQPQVDAQKFVQIKEAYNGLMKVFGAAEEDAAVVQKVENMRGEFCMLVSKWIS